MFRRFALLTLCLAGLASAAAAKVKVVTSTTDLAWAAKEIGGELVEVNPLLRGTENPHYVDAVPEFIRLAAQAQVVCVVGLDLEVGWMPKVLARSGNAQVQPGGRGYCETAPAIDVLEKVAGAVDRSMGDVHPAGNPHFWISPRHFGQGAKPIADTLARVDPANAAAYQKGYERLKSKLQAIQDKQKKKLEPLLANASGPVLIEYHKEFTYFLEAYGLKSQGSIEEKPGVAPSAGRLAEVALQAKGAGLKLAVAADTAPRKTLERFREMSGLPVLTVPLSLKPEEGPKTYEAHQDLLVDSLVRALTGKS